MINGQELYEIYTRHLLELGVGVDKWHDLDETDREAWKATAEEVRKTLA